MYSNVPVVHIAHPAFELTKEKAKEKKTKAKAPQTKIIAQTIQQRQKPPSC